MNGIKGYISIREASYRWGVSERRVNQYCAEGRIPGASRFGRSWAIPENAEKPSDPRFKAFHALRSPPETRAPASNFDCSGRGPEQRKIRKRVLACCAC